MNDQTPDRPPHNSLLWEMISAASRCRYYLEDSANLIENFFLGQFLPSGGCHGRDGQADLYYTVFTLQGLAALSVRQPESGLENYLHTFRGGERLDLVHLGCFARCRALIAREAGLNATCPSDAFPHAAKEKTPDTENESTSQPSGRIPLGASGHSPQPTIPVLERLHCFATSDGGYSLVPGSAHGTAYGLYLAMGIYEDLAQPLPAGTHWEACLRDLQRPEGGWANERGILAATVPAATAAAHVLRHLRAPVPESTCAWLLRHFHPQGGFRATLQAPIPDLLSTAVALHTLRLLGQNLDSVREACLNFIDSLWTNAGGFHGNWADDLLDSEYTFYGLLALGNLAASARSAATVDHS